jgi:hypothetical protein
MRRIVTSILGAALAAALLAAPATAKPPPSEGGRCTDSFTLMTIKELVKQGEDPALLDSIDANDNQQLCVKDLPENNGAGATNKIDDKS